jgi:hypothetical protein
MLPQPDHQASIEQAIASMSRAQGGGSASSVPPTGPTSTAPVFRVSGGDHAVSEFDDYFFSMAFPEIFPDGCGDLSVQRPLALDKDLAAWLEHLD